MLDKVDIFGARGEGDGVWQGDLGGGRERCARHIGTDGGARVGGGDVDSKLDAYWACLNGGTRIRTWSKWKSWERTARMKVPGLTSGLDIFKDCNVEAGERSTLRSGRH